MKKDDYEGIFLKILWWFYVIAMVPKTHTTPVCYFESKKKHVCLFVLSQNFFPPSPMTSRLFFFAIFSIFMIFFIKTLRGLCMKTPNRGNQFIISNKFVWGFADCFLLLKFVLLSITFFSAPRIFAGVFWTFKKTKLCQMGWQQLIKTFSKKLFYAIIYPGFTSRFFAVLYGMRPRGRWCLTRVAFGGFPPFVLSPLFLLILKLCVLPRGAIAETWLSNGVCAWIVYFEPLTLNDLEKKLEWAHVCLVFFV